MLTAWCLSCLAVNILLDETNTFSRDRPLCPNGKLRAMRSVTFSLQKGSHAQLVTHLPFMDIMLSQMKSALSQRKLLGDELVVMKT
jgi:hypothetical protein